MDGRDHRHLARPPRAPGGAGLRPGARAHRATGPGHRGAGLLLGLLLHLVPEVVPGGTAVACEPDPEHLEVGRKTAAINGVDIGFVAAAGGASDDEILELPSWNHPGTVHHVPVRSVPTLAADHDLDYIDVLHLDIQGAELAVLASCRGLIGDGRIRFVVVSTHHHTISGDPQTHQRCIDLVRDLGGHVVAEHTVLESFSGDGLLVASFDEADVGFELELSRARTTEALFPSGEQELERFGLAYEELRARSS
ncbi:MAG: FkbM family methyltransferase [Acidimicrobiia bacterium]